MEVKTINGVRHTIIKLQKEILLIVIDSNDWASVDKLENIYEFIKLDEYKDMDYRVLINSQIPSDIITLNKSGAEIAISCRIDELKNTMV